MQVARRYARALYEEAQRDSVTDAVDEDVDLISETLENSRELKNFFQSPVVSREKKDAVVRQLFESRMQPLTMRFLQMLIEKQRETVFSEIVAAYREMRDRQLGIVRAQAQVAVPLTDEDRMHLVEALERMTGQTVTLQVEERKELMGGVVVRVGDTVYDGSVRHHLDQLREQMETGGFALN